jgi:hypothetical protein
VRRNPAAVLLDALNEPDLDARVAEGLPWLALTYVDLDWDWLVRNAKLQDRQNRLGFAVSLASEVEEAKRERESTQTRSLVGHVGKGAACPRGYLLSRLHDKSGTRVAPRPSFACREPLESAH